VPVSSVPGTSRPPDRLEIPLEKGVRVPAPPIQGGAPSAGARNCQILNAMSVDVEDYFQVSAFETVVARREWDSYESRVSRNTDRLLAMFDRRSVRATFFVLGWVAERHPALIRRIHAAGHELASHGHHHGLVYKLSPRAFREDIRTAKAAIESVAGVGIVGYRAPSFSITRESIWALDILIEEGYAYDASIYPIHHDRYGISDWPRQISQVARGSGSIWEVPGSTVRHAGANWPIGGGGYFRLLPYAWTRYGIAAVNRRENAPTVFYVHPWEIDPEQPRIRTGLVSRIRHYSNLDKTEDRLNTLLTDFRFGTVCDVIAQMRPTLGGVGRDH
jgi:polysaccharide deacetylase family protein (PEP-CTERM system associated)